MHRRGFSSAFFGKAMLGIAVLFLGQSAVAQSLVPALPPIADPRDTRFTSVKEDWTTPSLTSSSLKVVPEMVMDGSAHPKEYTVQIVRAQWRWGDPIDLYVMKPAGVKKPPVIIYLYGYPSDTAIFRAEAWQRAATKDGFAAVGFMTALTGHRYHDRPMKEWFVSDLQECLAVSAHDVQMALNYLTERGDLDMNRVGIVGEGSGASIAVLASAVDPRIRALDLLDPWGDWPTWMAKSPVVPEEERPSYVTPEFLKKVAPLDPLDWLPKVQAKKFRLRDALFDDATPAAVHAKLRSAVPPGTTIVTYNTAEQYGAAVMDNKQMDWIYGQLRAMSDPTAALSAQRGSVTSPDPAPDHH